MPSAPGDAAGSPPRFRIGQNSTADQGLADLQTVFNSVDADSSGSIEQGELRSLLKRLNVMLSDPVEDVRSMFCMLDTDQCGRVQWSGFRSMFEGDIITGATANGTVDLDAIIKVRPGQCGHTHQ